MTSTSSLARTTDSHSSVWLVARALARLDQTPHLAEELRDAVALDDPTRAALTLLAAAAVARRAGCRGAPEMRAVRGFVRGALVDAGPYTVARLERVATALRSLDE